MKDGVISIIMFLRGHMRIMIMENLYYKYMSTVGKMDNTCTNNANRTGHE